MKRVVVSECEQESRTEHGDARRERFLLTLSLLLFLWGSVALAQDLSYDDSSAYDSVFGDDPYGDAEAQEAGPENIFEAKAQGRGYRLGKRTRSVREAEEQVHVVKERDTLWDISDFYFGDPWHWPEIWSYNPEITNPHWIYPLDQVRLGLATLAVDERVAEEKAVIEEVRKTGRVIERSPASTAGIMAGTEAAPSVVVPRELMTPQTVFLRDQGYLDKESMRTAGEITSGNEEQMWLAVSDQVYVKFAEDRDVRAGQQYTVFRPVQEWERHPEEEGHLVRILGTVAIRSYDRRTRIARGVITEALDPIERGQPVALMDRRFDLVSPARNEKNVVARIIASVTPYTLISHGDVVFLDVGMGKGVKAGNRFFVIRKGDEWLEGLFGDPQEMGNLMEIPPYEKEPLPKEVIAELRVLKVRKHTTIALVTRSDTDLTFGDTAEMRSGF